MLESFLADTPSDTPTSAMDDKPVELRKVKFFQLPAEVRLAIYKQLLPSSVLLSWDLCTHLADLWESGSTDLNLQNFWDTHHESPLTATRSMDTFVRRRPLSVEYTWPWKGQDNNDPQQYDPDHKTSSPQMTALFNLALTCKIICNELFAELFASLKVQATTPIELYLYSLRLPPAAAQQIRKLNIYTLCEACDHDLERDLVAGRRHAQWLQAALQAIPSLTCLEFPYIEIRKDPGMKEVKWRPKDLYALSKVAEVDPRLKVASFSYGAANPTAVVRFAEKQVQGWEEINFVKMWRQFLDAEVMSIDGDDLLALFDEGLED